MRKRDRYSTTALAGGRVRGAMSGAPCVILPLGSVEYHGPFAALGTDLFIAEELAGRVAEKLGAVIMPGVAYANCPDSTRSFPGTVHVSEKVSGRLITEAVDSVVAAGAKCVLVINCHDGHWRNLQKLSKRFPRRHPRKKLVVVHVWDMWDSREIKKRKLFSKDAGHGHGGPLEVSAAMAARPDAFADAGKVGPKLRFAGKDAELFKRGWKEASVRKGRIALGIAARNILKAVFSRLGRGPFPA